MIALKKISLIVFPIIGIFLLVWSFMIFELEQKVWVEKAETSMPFTYPSKEFADWWQEKYDNGVRISESYDPVKEFLAEKGIIVYDSKTEFRKELASLCEALGCTTGNVRMYLISKKDIPELNKLGFSNIISSNTTWVATKLLQCNTNPWEKHSITILKYYEKHGITIYNSAFKEDIENEVFHGCSSASTTIMFLLVSNQDIEKMQNLGYTVVENMDKIGHVSDQFTPK